MFVAREHELQVLEKLFTSDSFEMVVLYGRRRVGKTALIDEFVKDKRVLYWPFAVWCGWVCQVVTVLRSSLPQVR